MTKRHSEGFPARCFGHFSLDGLPNGVLLTLSATSVELDATIGALRGANNAGASTAVGNLSHVGDVIRCGNIGRAQATVRDTSFTKTSRTASTLFFALEETCDEDLEDHKTAPGDIGCGRLRSYVGPRSSRGAALSDGRSDDLLRLRQFYRCRDGRLWKRLQRESARYHSQHDGRIRKGTAHNQWRDLQRHVRSETGRRRHSLCAAGNRYRRPCFRRHGRQCHQNEFPSEVANHGRNLRGLGKSRAGQRRERLECSCFDCARLTIRRAWRSAFSCRRRW